MIRRSAFLKIFEQLKLPVCNERFGRATIPFYMPMTRTIEEGSWYLAEDYAFSERARQCGIKVYADTSIRLWHIGNYKFGWEDAGMDRPRFGTFTMNFSGQQGNQETSTEGTKLLSDFAADYPWPTQRPESQIAEFPERPSMDLADILGKHLDQNTSLLFEVGAGSGQLTRLLAKHPSRAKIIALDQWKKEDQANSDEIQDQFYAECWNQRQHIIPIPGELRQGIQTVADAKLEPDVVLVHTDSNDEAAAEILAGVFDCFPQAKVIGNNMTSDADWELVERITTNKNIHLQRHNQAWIANGE